MASIERTAYPRFKRFMSARELHVFYTPQVTGAVAEGRRGSNSGEALQNPRTAAALDFLYRNAISDEVVEAASDNPRHRTSTGQTLPWEPAKEFRDLQASAAKPPPVVGEKRRVRTSRSTAAAAPDSMK